MGKFIRCGVSIQNLNDHTDTAANAEPDAGIVNYYQLKVAQAFINYSEFESNEE